MAITTTTGTYYQYRKQQGTIDLVSDTIKAALVNDTFSFDRDKHKVWTAPAWSGSASYSLGDLVAPTTPNGYIYKVTVAGTSAGTEPTWPTSFGTTVTDGNGVEYECWSHHTAQSEITGSGYAKVTLSMTDGDAGQSEDESGDKALVHYDDIMFAASGGDFDASAGCVLFDDTDGQDTVIAGIMFGTTYTVTDGNNLTLKNPQIEDLGISTTA